MLFDFNKLIPNLQSSGNVHGFRVSDWLSCIADHEHAIVYAEFFWPVFFEYDGCIFRDSVDEENYKHWMNSTNGNRTEVEAIINHVHILDIFINAEQSPSKEQILHLGRKLKEMWQAKLKHDYPDRKVIVSFPEEDCEDLLEYEITVYQSRN